MTVAWVNGFGEFLWFSPVGDLVRLPPFLLWTYISQLGHFNGGSCLSQYSVHWIGNELTLLSLETSCPSFGNCGSDNYCQNVSSDASWQAPTVLATLLKITWLNPHNHPGVTTPTCLRKKKKEVEPGDPRIRHRDSRRWERRKREVEQVKRQGILMPFAYCRMPLLPLASSYFEYRWSIFVEDYHCPSILSVMQFRDI